MAYKAIFDGWENLDLADLLVAYRKAKADNFFENNGFPTAIRFAEYEEKLLHNLKKLHEELKLFGFSRSGLFLGDCRLIPKKLDVKYDNCKAGSHIHFSDPERAFDNLPENTSITPEFRIVGDFPVDTHIISALWINMVGHKFDESLDDKSCYASRLKRISGDDVICSKRRQKEFHIESIGSFQPYFQPYQRFRKDGIEAMRDELKKGEDIVAVSLDLKSYYHTLDPLALKSSGLRKSLGLVGDKKLSEAELLFTRELALFLDAWSSKASVFLAMSGKKLATRLNIRSSKRKINAIKDIGGVSGGLAIGLTASRIIGNIMLHHWDRQIKKEVSPVYYGRYVDDMFIVLRDPGDIHKIDDLMNLLSKNLKKRYLSYNKNGDWEVQQGEVVQGKSKIYFQAEKQKLFILSGQTGLDLLDNIEEEIRELSSERRLMPSPSDLENSMAVRVLSAVSGIGERPDTLRRSDGLSIQRLGLALHLRHVEALARDLPAGEWKKERLDFYDFVQNHILCTTNLLNNFSYIPRILGLAVSCGEWKRATCIVELSFQSIQQLFEHLSIDENIVVNGCVKKAASLTTKIVFDQINSHLIWIFYDTLARYRVKDGLYDDSKPVSLFISKLLGYANDFSDHIEPHLKSNLYSVAVDNKSLLDHYSELLVLSDLSYRPYKHLGSSYFRRQIRNTKETEVPKPLQLDGEKRIEIGRRSRGLLAGADFGEMKDLDSFLERRNKKIDVSQSTKESLLPYLFPTRPYTPAEIAELIPECIVPAGDFDPTLWPKYTRALRGVWIRGSILDNNDDIGQVVRSSSTRAVNIGTRKKEKITVALSNFKTEDIEWREMANDESKLKLERYKRIADLVNQAIKLEPRPDYLIFPELSIPIKWVDAVAAKLMAAGISLIAGTEYRHHGDKNNRKIFSQACLFLSDNKLGFPAWVKIWQSKVNPAVSEEKDLISKFGRTWECPPEPDGRGKREFNPKQVYNHNGFHFALMICSEMQNSKSRIDLQGDIDALFVLAWNQDLDTFSSLLESASLDIHAYTILVNNRKYGDSRVRSPAKKLFNRDLARVRGGNNDFIVSVTLDIESLRAFQSRDKRWPESTDEFKPVPEGYKILSSRKTLPSIE